MYKAGDEVFIKAEITDVVSCGTRPYFVKPDCYSINWVSEDKIIPMDKTYVDGLSDAWELAKKILYGIDKQLIEIFELSVEPAFFDLTHKRAIINDHTPEEALAKIEAYEKENEIKPTDIVEYNGKNWVVTEVYKGEYSIWNGKNVVHTKNVKKVGTVESIKPLEELLRQIGE